MKMLKKCRRKGYTNGGYHGERSVEKVLGGIVYFQSHGPGGVGGGEYVFQCIHLQNVPCLRRGDLPDGGGKLRGRHPDHHPGGRLYGLCGETQDFHLRGIYGLGNLHSGLCPAPRGSSDVRCGKRPSGGFSGNQPCDYNGLCHDLPGFLRQRRLL